MTSIGNIDGMRNGTGDERESAIQSGWTVEGRSDAVAASETASPGLPADDGSAAGVDRGLPGEPAALVSNEFSTGNSADAARQQMSNLTVVLLGVVGGISMLYAWVWMSWAQYYSVVNASVAATSGAIGGILQQVVFWIAPLAPVLWFITALAMQRRNPRRLALALVVGLIVTFPLPMVLSSGAAL